MKLHLGCGANYIDGYVNIDYPQSEHNHVRVRCDQYADITTLSFDEGSIEEIRLHHVFEHFGRVQALAMLVKWHMWLEVGGKLWIEVPDLDGCADDILHEPDYGIMMSAIRHMVGDQTAKWGYHVDQWNEQRLTKTLGSIGFGNIETRRWRWERSPYLANVEATCNKIRDLPLDRLIDEAKLVLRDSMVADSELRMWKIWCEQLDEMVL